MYRLEALIDDPAARREASTLEYTQAFLSRIEHLQPRLNAFLAVFGERALAEAALADRSGRAKPLAGTILAVKDNIAVAGAAMTAGSNLYAGYTADADAEVVLRARRAGAIVIGKTHLHELAMGATSDNPFYGKCRNPWDLDRTPGGSSGGSAVAVAADLCIAALGTDTGGSIRNPAAQCGVTGLRPSSGLTSNLGVVPVAPSFDTVGPMARSAADVLGLLEAMVTDARGLSAAFEGSAVTVGVVRAGYYDADLGDDVRRAMAESEACFKDSGARIVEVDPGDVETAAADFFQLLCREALEVHAVDLERRPELFSGPVRDRLLSTRVITGRRVAELRASGESWRKHVGGRIFGVCDVLLTPLQLEPPLAFSDPALNAGVGRAMRFTFPWSLAGLPALSLPCGAFKNGLPIGCQLVGPPLADRRLIELGMRFQSVTGWHRRRPPLPDF